MAHSARLHSARLPRDEGNAEATLVAVRFAS